MAFLEDSEIKVMDMEEIKKSLFRLAMKSKWNEVVTICELNHGARRTRITKAGDTALHIAVSEGREEVEQLVQLVSVQELQIRNERGNTPLHIAASLGNVRMCRCIARDHPSLVADFNKENETPLFLAALSGKKAALFCLHRLCISSLADPRYWYCRRNDGATILHCAIGGNWFDLAFHIINLYGDLVNYVNEQRVFSSPSSGY